MSEWTTWCGSSAGRRSRRRLRRAYGILFAGAVASLPVEYRRLLGLRRAWWPAKTLTGLALRGAGSALGRGPGSTDFAMERIARLV